MDPKVLYWTFAFINMGFVVGLGFYGRAQLKTGNAKRHATMMISASCLVVGFVVSYGFKLAILGREDLMLWSDAALNTLRFHETCVLAMVVAGGLAIRWGRTLRNKRSYTLNPDDPAASESLIRRHHRAGQVALVGAALGFVSSGFVLAGMYARMQ